MKTVLRIIDHLIERVHQGNCIERSLAGELIDSEEFLEGDATEQLTEELQKCSLESTFECSVKFRFLCQSNFSKFKQLEDDQLDSLLLIVSDFFPVLVRSEYRLLITLGP